jgi:hypothetical protein
MDRELCGEIAELCEVQDKISDLSKKLKELKDKRSKLIDEYTLRKEAGEFCERGRKASEFLRKMDRKLFAQKVDEIGYNWPGSGIPYYGMNHTCHYSIWELRVKPRICKKASNGREKYCNHLTVEEIKLAKEYAKEETEKWVQFWSIGE